MKYVIVLLCFLIVWSCEKKKETVDESPATSTTTGAVPTPTVISNTAEFEVNATDYNYAYASARFYSADKNPITVNSVKINGSLMGIYTNNEYRYALASSTYTSAVNWVVSSGVSYIPDTSFMSPTFPKIGYQKDITRTYDKSLDFVITVDVSECDSLFFTLGEVLKKIPGKSGITSITYTPADKVKYSVTDSTEVDVKVVTANYSLFNVRGKKWRSVSQSRSLSHYKYK
jgi:hypothetical protein